MSHAFTTHDGRSLIWPFSHIEPREVQLMALKKGFAKPGFAYFMRQRTGKTWTAYAEFCLMRNMQLCKWFVVTCPNSLKDQWMEAINDADMFTPVIIYESGNKRAFDNFFKRNKSDGGVVIINYESVKTLVGEDKELPFDGDKTYIVADESTKIKDASSKTSKACIKLADMCRFKRVLTGRPTANNNNDIWAQLRFIKCTNRNENQHKFTFCVVGGFQGRSVVKNINVELLQSEMEPISYIAEDKYVRGFKKIYEPMRRINLSGRLLELYKKMQDELVFQIGGGEIDISAPIVLTQYLRLQQISSGIAGDVDGMQHNLVDPADNPRIRVVKEIIESECQNKVIIVCRFRLSIKNLYEELTKEGYKCAVINGQMKGDQLEEMKRQFNYSDDVNILIAQESVLNFGHTLCAKDEKPCDTMIFYENSFSLINRAQCESRPEKYGRDLPISYYDMYSSKMDRYILETLVKKEDASMALLKYSRDMGMRPQGIKDEVDKQLTM